MTLEPTPERFRALARSSPWRFATLRFVHSDVDAGGAAREPVRAWLRRPGRLRVERLDGALVRAVREPRPTAGVIYFSAPKEELPERSARPPEVGPDAPPREYPDDGVVELAWPQEVTPRLRADGLVAQRPPASPLAIADDAVAVGYDDPMHHDYRWVAILDPWELADPREEGGDREPAATTVTTVAPVTHHGRAAWEAVLRPTTHYTPRCSCCALLLSAESDARQVEEGGPSVRAHDPSFTFAEAHRVRLDVATGVCVLTEQLGGSRNGAGHELRIEAVDEELPDHLFPADEG